MTLPNVPDRTYGLAWWGALCVWGLAVVAAQAWRDWRRAGDGRRVVGAAAVLGTAAAVAAALITPWRGPNAEPGPGRLLAVALVLGGAAWWRGRARRAP